MTVFKKVKTQEFTVVEINLETRVGAGLFYVGFFSSFINANVTIPIVVEKRMGFGAKCSRTKNKLWLRANK